VAYDHQQTTYVSISDDGGATFRTVTVKTPGFGAALCSGGATDGKGGVWFAWAGYSSPAKAKGPVTLFVTRSSDGGATWKYTTVDTSGSPPDCSTFQCDWAYLGAQMALAYDPGDVNHRPQLNVLWSAGPSAAAPERTYFASSTDGGATWSPRADVSAAGPGVDHCFPAIAAAPGGDVRIAWMDTRNQDTLGQAVWNVYYRSSTDGGAHWSAESQLSSYVPGFSYIEPEGFAFPFGDYMWLAIDGAGTTHAVFGEGLNWLRPGSIWYTNDAKQVP
jgi:hypothetical protein